MALSGSALGTKKGGWQIKMSWTATQNIAANTSAVSWHVYLVADTAWNIIASNAFAGSITVNGRKSTFSKNPSTNGGATILLGSGTTTVPHNSDGSKSCGISFTYGLNITHPSLGYIGALSGSTTANLNTIPRASTFIQSSGMVEMGANFTIKITPASAGFTHKLRFNFGSKATLIKDNPPVNTDFSFVLPAADYAPIIPNAATGIGGIFLDTYNGSTLLGTKSASLTLTVPASVVPTINSVALTDTSTVPSKLGVEPEDGLFVDGVSTLHFDVAAGGAYGSTIKQYNFTIDDKTYTSNSATYDLLNIIGAGAKSVIVGVIDTRGRKATATKDIVITAYQKPSLTAASITRDSNGAADTVTVKKTVVISSLKLGTVEKNPYTVVTEYKLPSVATWTNAKTENSTSAASFQITLDKLKGYDVRIVVKDKLFDTSFGTTIPTAKTLLHLYKDEGIGIGKFYEENHGVLDVGGDSHFEGNIFVNGKTLLNMFYPIGTIYESVNSENPSSFMGGTWERFGNGRVTVGVDENDTDFATANKTVGAKATTKIFRTGRNYGGVASGAGTGSYPYRVLVSPAEEENPFPVASVYPQSIIQPSIAVYRWKRIA